MTPVKSLNHIGIAVRSIDDHRPYYEDTLGAEFGHFSPIPTVLR